MPFAEAIKMKSANPQSNMDFASKTKNAAIVSMNWPLQIREMDFVEKGGRCF